MNPKKGVIVVSMPNIPDITPDINITLKDAVNLLLTSIAMEEISLSKLMDAETDKIKYVIEKCGCHKCCASDLLAINESVNATVSNMIKLQTLLQLKLESTTKLLPKEPPKPRERCCGLVGKGRGIIRCQCDDFSGAEAVLNAFVFSNEHKKEGSLTYSASYSTEKHKQSLHLCAYPKSLRVQCPDECEQTGIVVTGKAKAVRTFVCDEPVKGDVDFYVTVWDSPPERRGFHMLVASDCVKALNHDSGYVSTKNSCSGLQIELCC